jgi:hypothetical protein
MFKPVRDNRSDWCARWKGAVHYIGHFKWIDWKTMTYRDLDPKGSGHDTPRTLKCVELLRATGIVLIQRDKPDGSFQDWHSAWRIADLKVRENGAWLEFRLVELLRND